MSSGSQGEAVGDQQGGAEVAEAAQMQAEDQHWEDSQTVGGEQGGLEVAEVAQIQREESQQQGGGAELAEVAQSQAEDQHRDSQAHAIGPASSWRCYKSYYNMVQHMLQPGLSPLSWT